MCVFAAHCGYRGIIQALREIRISPVNFSSWEKCLHTPQFDKDELYQSTITQFKPLGANSMIFFVLLTPASFNSRCEPASVPSSGPQSLAIEGAPFRRKRGSKAVVRYDQNGRHSMATQLKLATETAIFRRDLIRPFSGARLQRVEFRSAFRRARGMSK